MCIDIYIYIHICIIKAHQKLQPWISLISFTASFLSSTFPFQPFCDLDWTFQPFRFQSLVQAAFRMDSASFGALNNHGHSHFSLMFITNFWNKISRLGSKNNNSWNPLQGTTISAGCNQRQLRKIRIRPEVELHCRIVFDNHQNIFQSHWRLTWSLRGIPLVLRHVLAFFMSITVPFSNKVFALDTKFFTKTALGRIEDELAPKQRQQI